MDHHKENYYFKEEHGWIRFENDYAFIGMTALAKRELGIITNIEIHTTGEILTENQVFGTITTEKYLCKLIMPLRGKIVEANVINYEKFNTMDEDFDPDEWIVDYNFPSSNIKKIIHAEGLYVE